MPALIVDPALQAAVIRQFNLRGELAPFQLTEQVVPIFDIGQLIGETRDPTVVTTLLGSQGVRVGTLDGNTVLPVVIGPALSDTDDVFDDSGIVTNPAANTVLINLVAPGVAVTEDIEIFISADVIGQFVVEWRNAANAANLETWTVIAGGPSSSVFTWRKQIRFAGSERIRVSNIAMITGDVAVSGNTNRIDVSSAA